MFRFFKNPLSSPFTSLSYSSPLIPFHSVSSSISNTSFENSMKRKFSNFISNSFNENHLNNPIIKSRVYLKRNDTLFSYRLSMHSYSKVFMNHKKVPSSHSKEEPTITLHSQSKQLLIHNTMNTPLNIYDSWEDDISHENERNKRNNKRSRNILSKKLFIAFALALCFSSAIKIAVSKEIHAESLFPGYRRMDKESILEILRRNEQIYKNDSSNSIISSIHYNQYAANMPIEDYKVVEQLDERSNILGVFDGHGGDDCSKWISSNIVPIWRKGIWEYLEKIKQVGAYYDVDDMGKDIDSAKVNRKVRNQLKNVANIQEFIPKIFNETFQFMDKLYYESYMIEDRIPKSGSCAIVGYTLDKELFIANLGDSRAVLGKKDWLGSWKTVALSKDQTANSEREKLQKEHPMDPQVVQDGRVKGILQPSRSFGDYILKVNGLLSKAYLSNYQVFDPPYVSSIPEVRYFSLNPKSDKFIVLATDGLWDNLSNEEVVNIVSKFMEENIGKNPTEYEENVSTKLIKEALLRNPIKDNYNQRNILITEDENLSIVLGLPQNKKRYIHDDITVLVAFFREDYQQSKEGPLPNSQNSTFPENIQQVIRKSEARARKIKNIQNKSDL